jgi:transcriptional regulator with XRE-family HTH domain
MSKKKIKKLLIDRDITQTELARRLGIPLTGVNQVISGKRKTKHIQEGIARLLGIKASRLFREQK